MSQMLLSGLQHMVILRNKVIEHEQELIQRWKDTTKLSRKKKKQLRRKIKVEWSICQWSKSMLMI